MQIFRGKSTARPALCWIGHRERLGIGREGHDLIYLFGMKSERDVKVRLEEGRVMMLIAQSFVLHKALGAI
jgi:hypothetical protein